MINEKDELSKTVYVVVNESGYPIHNKSRVLYHIGPAKGLVTNQLTEFNRQKEHWKKNRESYVRRLTEPLKDGMREYYEDILKTNDARFAEDAPAPKFTILEGTITWKEYNEE